MFYAKSTSGFYTTEIHGENIPDDAVEISNEDHAALLQKQSEGMRIVADEDGKPIWIAPPPPTDEEQAAAVRAQRDELLAKTDWRFRSDMNPSQAWKDYCQGLRDVTEQAGFPSFIEWPVAP